MVKLIALDLDGTLLDTEKRLSPGNRNALFQAAEAGIEIVPTTGRYYGLMPEVIRELPFLHYAITVNGAQVYDICNDRVLAREEMPASLALEIFRYLDTLPVIYDCYLNDGGYMSRDMKAQLSDYLCSDPHYLALSKKTREPVDDLKEFVASSGASVQKIQMFFQDLALRETVLQQFEDRFPETAASAATTFNIEINSRRATKGQALTTLCGLLDIPVASSLSMGDGLNDCSMIRDAGIGVAMGNAMAEVKAISDFVTDTCNEDGVAAAIRHFCF